MADFFAGMASGATGLLAVMSFLNEFNPGVIFWGAITLGIPAAVLLAHVG